MPCKYTEHIIACGTGGGYTVTGRLPPHKHDWEPNWHMGYIIGRQCKDESCKRVKHMSKKWCDAQMAKLAKR